MNEKISKSLGGRRKSGGYYVPMADLLTGLVFILVILLTGITITSRPEFETQLEIEAMRNRLKDQLEKLQSIETNYIRPREKNHDALMLLMNLIASDLEKNRVKAVVDRLAKVIVFNYEVFFRASADNKIITNSDNIDLLAKILLRRIACLSNGKLKPQLDCANLLPLRISRMVIIVNASDTSELSISRAGAEAAALYGHIMESAPEFGMLRDKSGRPVVGHMGYIHGPDRGVRIHFELEEAEMSTDIWMQEQN